MRRYDVLVVDLDGTLLGRDSSISPQNISALKQARDAGIEVIVATGRAWAESTQAFRAIQHQGLVICAGGSLLCEAGTGRTIERRAMHADLVRDVVRMLVDHDHRALVLKDRHAVGYDYLLVGPSELNAASSWWFGRLPVEIRTAATIDDDPHPDDSMRAGAVACGSRLAGLALKLKNCFGDRASMQHWSAVTEHEPTGASTHLLEVFHRDVDKWSMVQSWCARHHVSLSRVAAIGDGLNDVQLVANAALGIAMGNAIDEVKRVAHQSVPAHDQDGVAIAVDHILAGRW